MQLAKQSAPQDQAPEPERPAFMVKLGLLPPYTVEDIEAVYRDKAKTAHPDRGGSASEFRELKEAVDCAREFAQLRQSRRQWLAVNVERYARQEEVCGEVRRRGGQVEIEQIDWMKQSFGDFAVVTERLRGIRLQGSDEGDEFLSYLAERAEALGYLLWLDMAGSRISDPGLLGLGRLKGLRRLNLSGTPISPAGLKVLEALPDLEWINLAGTLVGWWARLRLRWSFRRLRVVTAAAN